MTRHKLMVLAALFATLPLGCQGQADAGSEQMASSSEELGAQATGLRDLFRIVGDCQCLRATTSVE